MDYKNQLFQMKEKELRTEIGKLRLLALRSSGYRKTLLNIKANELEQKLREEVIKKYNY